VIERSKANFLRVLTAQSPDLIFLQETKLQEVNTAKFSDEFPGFTTHFSCSQVKKGYAGTALLVREGFRGVKSVSFGLHDDTVIGHDEGRSITVELDSFYFVGLYSVNSGQNLERLTPRLESWDTTVRKYLKVLGETKPVVLGGDLNVAHRDIDIWNYNAKHIVKQAGCTPQERASFTAMLSEDSLVDSWRHLHPLATGWYSYWSTRAGNRLPNRGLRLDYFVVPEAMMDKSKLPHLHDSWIIEDAEEVVSDHGPIVCDVAI